MPQKFSIEISTCHPAFVETGIPQIASALRRFADQLEQDGMLLETRLRLADGTPIGDATWHGKAECGPECIHATADERPARTRRHLKNSHATAN